MFPGFAVRPFLVLLVQDCIFRQSQPSSRAKLATLNHFLITTTKAKRISVRRSANNLRDSCVYSCVSLIAFKPPASLWSCPAALSSCFIPGKTRMNTPNSFNHWSCNSNHNLAFQLVMGHLLQALCSTFFPEPRRSGIGVHGKRLPPKRVINIT